MASRRDVVATIFDVADELDVRAIAFRSRDRNRLIQFLSDDTPLKLVTEADLPVIALLGEQYQEPTTFWRCSGVRQE